MARTVGCSDLNQGCSFRITADTGEDDMMVDVATDHAMTHHRDLAPDEESFRSAIRSHIRTIMTQAHMSSAEVNEVLG
jgi:predicted small metal-binding protein